MTGNDFIHLYLFSLKELKRYHNLVTTSPYLIQDEIDSLTAIRAESRRDEIQYGRFILRALLYHRYQSNDKKITLHKAPSGKPFVRIPGQSISYNVAHDTKNIAIAISNHTEVGVDIESPFDRCSDNSIDKLGERFFVPSENHYIQAGSTDEKRVGRFFSVWTIKEAVVKCTGEGLSRNLDTFDLTDIVRSNMSDFSIEVDQKNIYGCRLLLDTHLCQTDESSMQSLLALCSVNPIRNMTVFKYQDIQEMFV